MIKEEYDETEKNNIIKKLHEENGHSGIEVTYITVLQRFKWKGMYQDICRVIKNCHVCKKFSDTRTNLQKFRIQLEEPFYRISIDCIGPMPKSSNNKKYIIVAIDHVSRWIETLAVGQKNVKNISLFLINNIFCRHGIPSEILSDMGMEFNNKIVIKICEIMNSKKTFASAYNPKCNGVVERCNRTLIMKLSKLCNNNWKERMSI